MKRFAVFEQDKLIMITESVGKDLAKLFEQIFSFSVYYEHRCKNPDYATYQANMARILDKSSYINQWTAELFKSMQSWLEVQKVS